MCSLQYRRQRIWLMTVVLTVILASVLGFTNIPFARQSVSGPQDPVELGSFMDGMIRAQMKAYGIAGATVAVVKNGSLLFAKGYGYADVKEKKPVQAGRTLFRIGSISKLFVWTAVMQLVEQGKLDLNKDINTYLSDFKIPGTYDQPITLTHLMTHTPGFEDHVIGLFAEDPDRLLPLGELLTRELPARVRPPGEVTAYSNHGTGIAAYIVEQESGLPWDDYVDKNILKPLGMTHTTFRQPVPEPLAGDASKAWVFKNGEFTGKKFVYVPLSPVGSASTTATDLSKFMIAHLNHGQLGDARILEEATARQMQQPLFRHSPETNAFAHGFYEISMNNQRVIAHGGGTRAFFSLMALLPDEDLGLFISVNSVGGGRLPADAYKLFMNHYYPPVEKPALTPSGKDVDRLDRFTGIYMSTRRPHRRLTKLAGPVMGGMKVVIEKDGALKTFGPEAIRWIQVKPLVFQEEQGTRMLVFREDENGSIEYLFRGDLSVNSFERVQTADSLQLHSVLAGLVLLLFALTVLVWPSAAFVLRRQRIARDPSMHLPRFARVIAWLTSSLLIITFVGLAIVLTEPDGIVFGIPSSIKILLVAPILAAILAIGALIYTVRIWKSGSGSIWGRIYYTAVTLAFVIALWQLNHWNLLGFHY